MKRFLLLCILILSSTQLSAGDICIHRRYSQPDGLRDVSVNQITQDRYGRVWIATRGGISCFNGKRFTDYPGEGTYFYQISCDRYGRVWGTTITGECFRSTQDPNPPQLERPDLQDQEVISIHNPSGSQETYFLNRKYEIHRVLFDKDGTVVGSEAVFSAGEGAYVYDMTEDEEGTLWTLTSNGLFRNKTRLRSEAVFCFDRSERGLVFGSEDGALLRLQEGVLSRIQSPLHDDITLLCCIPGSMDVLIGSEEEGVKCWVPEHNSIRDIPFNSYQNGAIRAFEDINGKLWLYSLGGGLTTYDPEAHTTVEFYDAESQVGWNSEITLQTIFPDNQGHLWYSTSNGLIVKSTFYPDNFTLSPVSVTGSGEVSAENSTRAFLVDREGRFVVTTRDSKTHMLDSGMHEIRAYNTPDPGYCLLQTHDGSIWVGTGGGGLIELRDEGRERRTRYVYTRDEDAYYGINGRFIYHLCENTDHRLWIASLDGGISYVDLNKTQREFISKQNRLVFPTGDVNALRHITFGPNGWLYTCGALGLFISENPTAEPEEIRFRQVESLRNKDVLSIFFTRDGSMYACVSGLGLLCFDKHYDASAYRTVSTAQGLLSEYILSAVEDQQGSLWIVSQAGLNRYNPESGQVESFSLARIGHPLSFNEGLGLCDEDNRIYLHTNSGILHFNPQDIAGSRYAPYIAFTSLKCNGKDALLNGDILSVHRRDRIDLEFQAIDHGAADRILYYFRIPEQNRNWQYLGYRPQLSLDAFKTGSITLELRSTNGDGVQTDNVRTIHIHSRLSPGGIIRNLFVAFLLMAAAAAGATVYLRRRKPAEPKEWRNETELKFIQDLDAFIDANLDNGNLDVNEMSAAMNMGRSAFYDWTKRLIGEAPSEYLRKRRLEKAKELLRLGGRSIYEIADMTGFNDSRYFSTTFHKIVGVTPSRYRKQFAGKDTTAEPKGDSE